MKINNNSSANNGLYIAGQHYPNVKTKEIETVGDIKANPALVFENDEAYKVDISKPGKDYYEKVVKDNPVNPEDIVPLENFATVSAAVKNAHSDDENELILESEAYTEYVNRMDKILGKIDNKETVSNKDKDWLEGELRSILSGHYDNLKSIKLERQDILEELKTNMAQRNRLLDDMLKQTEAYEGANLWEQFTMLQEEFEIKDKEELIEKLTEAMKDEEDNEEIEKENDKSVEENSEDDSGDFLNSDSILLNHDIKENERRAGKQIDENENAIDIISKQAEVEREKSQYFAEAVDKGYEATEKFINSSEHSDEEKAEAVSRYMMYSSGATQEKEVYRIKYEFDLETVRIARSLFNNHDDLTEVLKGRNNKMLNMISKDIAMKLLKE